MVLSSVWIVLERGAELFGLRRLPGMIPSLIEAPCLKPIKVGVFAAWTQSPFKSQVRFSK